MVDHLTGATTQVTTRLTKGPQLKFEREKKKTELMAVNGSQAET